MESDPRNTKRMTEALVIEELYKKIGDTSLCGEGLEKETGVREEESSATNLELVEKVNRLRRQLKVAEEDRQRQVMVQKQLVATLTAERESHAAKLEERTDGLKTKFNPLLSDLDFVIHDLAIAKKSAEVEALIVSKLEQKVSMMANDLKQQEDTTSALYTRIEQLEEERQRMLQLIQQMPLVEEQTASKSDSGSLIQSQRSLQEETKPQVEERSEVAAEITQAKKQKIKKTKGFSLKRWLCCCVA